MVVTTIVCDGCGNEVQETGPYTTKIMYRNRPTPAHVMRNFLHTQYGWVQRGRYDYCNECKEHKDGHKRATKDVYRGCHS